MRVVIPGGSGQIGTLLARAFVASGDEVIVLTRRPPEGPWKMVEWDGRTIGPWGAAIDGADVVINLAGRSVDCRYNAANRRAIMESRVQSTNVIGEAIRRASRPPALLLQAGTATIYAHRFDAPNDEATGIVGGAEPNAPDTWRFSIDVAKAWEAAAQAITIPARGL
jgi:NAD dependent epimerase/dehydratase family enzyme